MVSLNDSIKRYTNTPDNIPKTYKGEEIKGYEDAGTNITITGDGKLNTLDVEIIDGTNIATIDELMIAVRNYSAPSDDEIIIAVYREDTDDGETPTTTPIFKKVMTTGSRVFLPSLCYWGIEKLKITSNTAITIDFDVRGRYYTPD